MGLRKLKSVSFAVLFITALFCTVFAHAAGPYEVLIERDVTARMRDGAVLRADVYRPKADGKFPVLLQRTPYDKNVGVAFGVKAAAHGFVAILQDVRGRYASEGEWYTFKHESE